MGNSARPGWAAGVARLFARVFFSVGGAGVASSSARGVSSAMGGGFSLDASVGISMIGPDGSFFGRGIGVASTVIAGSKSLGEAKAWARATCDAPNAILLHSIERRIPLWKHIKKLSAAFRSPQSAIRNQKLGLFPLQILHLLRSIFATATAIRPLFNQFVGRHGVKRNNGPIRVSSNESGPLPRLIYRESFAAPRCL